MLRANDPKLASIHSQSRGSTHEAKKVIESVVKGRGGSDRTRNWVIMLSSSSHSVVQYNQPQDLACARQLNWKIWRP
jgi:hypothetical protein